MKMLWPCRQILHSSMFVQTALHENVKNGSRIQGKALNDFIMGTNVLTKHNVKDIFAGLTSLSFFVTSFVRALSNKIWINYKLFKIVVF